VRFEVELRWSFEAANATQARYMSDRVEEYAEQAHNWWLEEGSMGSLDKDARLSMDAREDACDATGEFP
jgi:hypothetical protein